jgi:hypothetical protein
MVAWSWPWEAVGCGVQASGPVELMLLDGELP